MRIIKETKEGPISLEIQNVDKCFSHQDFCSPVPSIIDQYHSRKHRPRKYFRVKTTGPYTLIIQNREPGQKKWKTVYEYVVVPETGPPIKYPVVLEYSEKPYGSRFKVVLRKGSDFIPVEFIRPGYGKFNPRQDSPISLKNQAMKSILNKGMIKNSFRSLRNFNSLSTHMNCVMNGDGFFVATRKFSSTHDILSMELISNLDANLTFMVWSDDYKLKGIAHYTLRMNRNIMNKRGGGISHMDFNMSNALEDGTNVIYFNVFITTNNNYSGMYEYLFRLMPKEV